MPRKSRSEVQSPETEPRRRSSRLAALPQTSPEPKRTPRTPKTPASAEKPERRGRPSGSTKKAASPKKEVRGRKRKAVAEAAEGEEPEEKASKETEQPAAETTQENQDDMDGAGDAAKDAGDDAPDEKEEENGQEETAETKEEKMETNQDKAPKPFKPIVQASVPTIKNPVVTIIKGQISESSTGSLLVKQPGVTQPSTPTKIIEPTASVTSPSISPSPVVTPSPQPSVPKATPIISQSASENKVEPVAETETPAPAKEPADTPTSQPSRTENPQPTQSSVPEPPQIVPPPKADSQPEGTPQVQISISPVHTELTDADNVAGQSVLHAFQAVDSSPQSHSPPPSEPIAETVSSEPYNPHTDDGADMLSGFRQRPPSLPSLQYLTKPEITITPASDAEHSPTPASSGGAESDEFEERVEEKPTEEPTKEQDLPNNNIPDETIDNLKKDPIQHDGMNNGESVTPATVTV